MNDAPVLVGRSTENSLERLINTLNEETTDISQNPSNEEIKSSIKFCNKSLKRDKQALIKYVPYKLLSPFFEADGLEEGLAYIRKDKRKELIMYMAEIGVGKQLLYTIIDGKGLDRKVRINKHWRTMLLRNYSVISSWVQYVERCTSSGGSFNKIPTKRISQACTLCSFSRMHE